MLKIRKASVRGHADPGWLNSYYTFSFADYHDPARDGVAISGERQLRIEGIDKGEVLVFDLA